jgi:septal ring factor EnvC (AmiA/AmiB activator)
VTNYVKIDTVDMHTSCPVASKIEVLEKSLDLVAEQRDSAEKALKLEQAKSRGLGERLKETSTERSNAQTEVRILKRAIEALLQEEVTSVCQRIRSILSTNTP